MNIIRCPSCGNSFNDDPMSSPCPKCGCRRVYSDLEQVEILNRQRGHDVVGFGKLGESPKAHEDQRVAALPDVPLTDKAIAVRGTDRIDMTLAAETAARKAVTYVMRTELAQLREVIAGITHDIKANSDLVRTIDVPLEQVAASHERASASFENLRHDISAISARLAGVEQVIDTAGLKKAQGGAEARFATLCDLLEKTVKGLQAIEGGALETARVRLTRAQRKPSKKRRKR